MEELLPNREACWVSTVHSTRQLALACHFAVQLCSPPRSICLEFGQNRTLLASKYKNEKEIVGEVKGLETAEWKTLSFTQLEVRK